MKLSLKYRIDDQLEIDGEIYKVDAAFDVLLRAGDLLDDEKLAPSLRVSTALAFLIGTDKQIDKHLDPNDEYEFLSEYNIETRADILNQILSSYIDTEQEERRDLAGNVMPPKSNNKQLLDFDYDANEIYASFMQAYGIDLIEEQGKLHWRKFTALLRGLPENTAIKRLVSIRGWDPADDKKKYEQAMREAQEEVAIPDDKEV